MQQQLWRQQQPTNQPTKQTNNQTNERTNEQTKKERKKERNKHKQREKILSWVSGMTAFCMPAVVSSFVHEVSRLRMHSGLVANSSCSKGNLISNDKYGTLAFGARFNTRWILECRPSTDRSATRTWVQGIGHWHQWKKNETNLCTKTSTSGRSSRSYMEALSKVKRMKNLSK